MVLIVDPSQHKYKNCYYYSFKTRINGRPGQGSTHMSGGLTRVNMGPHKNKSGYYHSFKTQFKS
jgi:hypothetical protein